VRVGIHTGEAVVALGARPEEARGSSPAMSSTRRRASERGTVNGIAVSEQTYRATERIFDYEALEPVQ
jgi:class 3 adenylate cyclase